MDLASGLARRGHRVALWALYPWPESYCDPREGLEWNYVVSDRPSGPVQVEGISAADGSRCGIAVPPDDPAGLAHAMTRLLDDPDEYSRRAADARRLGDEASFERMVGAYETLLA